MADSIYTYMDHRTLAGIVAATRKMMDDGNYSNLEPGVEAGQVLAGYIGHDEAQAMIDALMHDRWNRRCEQGDEYGAYLVSIGEYPANGGMTGEGMLSTLNLHPEEAAQ